MQQATTFLILTSLDTQLKRLKIQLILVGNKNGELSLDTLLEREYQLTSARYCIEFK